MVCDGGGVLGRLGTDGRGGTEEFCPEFGSGWKRLGTKRSKGDKKGTLDYHYISPGGHKFKSKPEVKKFLACLEDPRASGDENAALTLYQNSNKPTTYQLRQVQEMRWDMLTAFYKFLQVHPQDVFPCLRTTMPYHPFVTYVFLEEDEEGNTKFTRAHFIHVFIQRQVARLAKYRRRGVEIEGTEMIPSDYDLLSGVPRRHMLQLNNLEWDNLA